MPAGVLLTVPVPVLPVFITLNANSVAVNSAVTALGSVIVRVQVLAVPVQAPDQPLNTDLGSATALKITVPLVAKDAWQSKSLPLQFFIPPGLLLTVPQPVPFCV